MHRPLALDQYGWAATEYVAERRAARPCVVPIALGGALSASLVVGPLVWCSCPLTGTLSRRDLAHKRLRPLAQVSSAAPPDSTADLAARATCSPSSHAARSCGCHTWSCGYVRGPRVARRRSPPTWAVSARAPAARPVGRPGSRTAPGAGAVSSRRARRWGALTRARRSLLCDLEDLHDLRDPRAHPGGPGAATSVIGVPGRTERVA